MAGNGNRGQDRAAEVHARNDARKAAYDAGGHETRSTDGAMAAFVEDVISSPPVVISPAIDSGGTGSASALIEPSEPTVDLSTLAFEDAVVKDPIQPTSSEVPISIPNAVSEREVTTAAGPAGVPNTWVFGTVGNEVVYGADSRNDEINGGGGLADTLVGGSGDDWYIIGGSGEVVFEEPNGGVDTLRLWVSSPGWLPENVENIILEGTAQINAYGNDLANWIVGNSANNALEGRGGDDVLTGGGGQDTIYFGLGSGHDRILDFVPGEDTVRVPIDSFDVIRAALRDAAEGAVLELPSGETLTFVGRSTTDLTARDFGLDTNPTESLDPPMLGVYVGIDNDVPSFEQWLGRKVDGVLGYTGDRDWMDMDPGWTISQLPGSSIFFSIPLFPQTSTLEAVAGGAGNAYFTQYAQKIVASATPARDGNFYVRTAWEMGGEWFSWGQQGNHDPELFKAAFRSFADAFHAVSDRFKIVWDVAADRSDPTVFYPGDEYVDVIGQDFYWNEWMSDDGGIAFRQIRDAPFGLQWIEDFADAHGKPTAYSEWGVKAGYDATEFIEAARDWFNDPQHDVVYQTYWDSDAAYPGRLSDGSDPLSGAAYRDAFGLNL